MDLISRIEKKYIVQAANEKVVSTVRDLIGNPKYKSVIPEMLKAADAGIALFTIQKNSKMVAFNHLSKEFLTAIQHKDEKKAIELGEHLVAEGHGEAFGLK